MLEGTLLETQETLEVNNAILEETVFLQSTINLIMGRLPLLGEDSVVLQD